MAALGVERESAAWAQAPRLRDLSPSPTTTDTQTDTFMERRWWIRRTAQAVTKRLVDTREAQGRLSAPLQVRRGPAKALEKNT